MLYHACFAATASATTNTVLQPTVSGAQEQHQQQAFHQIITINAIPLDKTIEIVQPDVVTWYQSQFLYRSSKNKCVKNIIAETKYKCSFNPLQSIRYAPKLLKCDFRKQSKSTVSSKFSSEKFKYNTFGLIEQKNFEGERMTN